MDPGPLRDGLTAVAGVGTGILSGLFGVGGAVISTPAIRALGASAAIAVGTTLPAIIPGAATGTARYLREGLVDPATVRATAPAGVVAAIVGSLLADVVPGDGHVLMLVSAALLGYSAIRMARQDDPVDAPDAAESDPALVDDDGDHMTEGDDTARPPARTATPDRRRLAGIGATGGLLSGLLGVGGGVILVPGFAHYAGMPVKRAIATSLACVALFAVSGSVTHGLAGNIDWRFALLLAAGVVPGARIGAALTIAADARTLRRVVAAFLGVTAVLYAVGELAALA